MRIGQQVIFPYNWEEIRKGGDFDPDSWSIEKGSERRKYQ